MTTFERRLLTALRDLGETDSVTLRKHLDQGVTSWWRETSLGKLHSTLTALEEQRLISIELRDPTPERGMRPKRYVRLTRDGERALEETSG